MSKVLVGVLMILAAGVIIHQEFIKSNGILDPTTAPTVDQHMILPSDSPIIVK